MNIHAVVVISAYGIMNLGIDVIDHLGESAGVGDVKVTALIR